MPRKGGGKRRKSRTHTSNDDGEQQADGVPRSLVVARGRVPIGIRELITDLRIAFAPHTALKLRERKSNSLKDYVAVASKLHVTHAWLFSATERAPYVRVGRLPQGPTLTMRVEQYATAASIRGSQRRPVVLTDGDRATPPLLVLNNFTGSKEVELMAETLRRAFPAIDVSTLRLTSVRRVLLIERDGEDGTLRMRHYAVRVQPAGLSRPVRKLVRGRVPSMRRLRDVAEYMDDEAGYSSESDVEDVRGEQAAVTLAQDVRRLRQGASSKVRLVEVGPRLDMQLVKVEGGLCQGAVLYHKFVQKTASQAAEDRARVDSREQLRKKRRLAQEDNVRRKEDVKRARKERRKERARQLSSASVASVDGPRED